GQSRAQDILSEIENPDLPMEQRIAKLQQTEVLLDSGGNGESGSGTIPFSRVNPEEKRGFDSPQAMMNFLMDMEARRGQQGKEAKAVLNELFLRKEKAMKETGKSFTVKIPTDEELAEGKGLKDILHEKWKRRQQRKEEVEE
ncbi:MAG: hypothetical protein OEX77_12115, partial [Candidatus Bathyarchaeota archaeon]|nr:hypothetical protein [Candidatus Bathyarchaeota archaeon]